jgi:hypothetical protein
MFDELRSIETFLDVVRVGGLAFGVGEVVGIDPKLAHCFHSFLKIVVFCFVVYVVLPYACVGDDSHLGLGVSFNIIGPGQSSQRAIFHTYEHYLVPALNQRVILYVFHSLGKVLIASKVKSLVLYLD